jgi:hypothetical protein
VILPTKRISAGRSLLGVGAELLLLLDEPKTISRLWDDFKREPLRRASPPSFESVVLALDLLFALGALEHHQGRLTRTRRRGEAAR